MVLYASGYAVPTRPAGIKPAADRQRGVQTFYVKSLSKPGVQYAVRYIRRAGMRQWLCSCPDWFYRRSAKATHRHCKHISILEVLAKQAGGITRLLSNSDREVA